MDKFEKDYRTWKSQTKNRLNIPNVKNLVDNLVRNKISESELENLGTKVKQELREDVGRAGINKTQAERDSWAKSLEDSFDNAQASHFPGTILNPIKKKLSSADLNAQRAGFPDKESMDDYTGMYKDITGEIAEAMDRVKKGTSKHKDVSAELKDILNGLN